MRGFRYIFILRPKQQSNNKYIIIKTQRKNTVKYTNKAVKENSKPNKTLLHDQSHT